MTSSAHDRALAITRVSEPHSPGYQRTSTPLLPENSQGAQPTEP